MSKESTNKVMELPQVKQALSTIGLLAQSKHEDGQPFFVGFGMYDDDDNEILIHIEARVVTKAEAIKLQNMVVDGGGVMQEEIK